MDVDMELDSADRIEGRWQDDAGLKRVNAVVVILGCALSATTYRMQKQRLLDVLNHSIVANCHRIGKRLLLKLTDLNIL